MLIIDKFVEENLVYMDRVILLMQELGFVLNQEKSVMIPPEMAMAISLL